ncbi:MAG: CCA tRNA nucleotidyltransferase [Alphaproteobacteria bacterium]|nr:MAG: CCA tRNA nucleotidyltransferase [Alphaproteobacteria bacterium]
MTTRRRLEAPWLTAPETEAVVAALGPGNLRFVGGAVRDSLVGRPVTDIDIATPLTPDEVMRRAAAAGLKAIPTGIDHGTVTLVSDHRPFEVTTLRRDVETFGRRARVAFTDDWNADAARRDFTINALYADAEGQLYDYFGGVADLEAGRVRFIGDPRERIIEDALRILRFFRFHAHFGRGALDAGGLAACIGERHRLDQLSIERVRDELLKLLAAPDPVPALEAMQEAGILDMVLPEARSLDALRRLVGIDTALARVDPLRRLAALLGRDSRRLERVGGRLRLSNRERRRLAAMAGEAPRADACALRAAAYRFGCETTADRLILGADPARLPELQAAMATLADLKPPRFPLKGRDLVAAGHEPGPELGRTLARLEEEWVASDFALSKAELLRRATGNKGGAA